MSLSRRSVLTSLACQRPARVSRRQSLLVSPGWLARNMSSESSAPAAELPSRVGVVGGGQMGTGIAYVLSVQSGLPVTLVDSRQSQLDSSRTMIRGLLDKDERKGKLSATARREAEERFAFTSQLDQVSQQPTHSQPPQSLTHSARHASRGRLGPARTASAIDCG